MRRSRTPTTAWPAVADLMTVLAVVGLFVAAASRIGDDPSPPSPQAGDSVWISRDSIGRLSESAKTLGESVDRANDRIGTMRDTIDALRDRLEIGFLPCWRRNGAGGYYFTYDVTYENNSYRFGLHADFDTAADALGVDDGLVRALSEFPQEPVNADEMRNFGERVDETTATAYTDRPGCKLAVSLNLEASGNETSVITQAGFYPIYRD